MLVEFIGYGASFFVVLSLLMSNVKWLRYLNCIGCVLFVIYGLVIAAYPVAVMNGAAVFINLYHLYKMKSK